MRSSRVGSRAPVLALALAIAGGAATSAHRRDEYLQAARIAIDAEAVRVDLDLTPGIAIAEAVITEIDRNRDGTISRDEQLAYGSLVVRALEIAVDGTPLPVQLDAASFPDADAMRRGEGAIRLQCAAALPRLAGGAHQLLFRNRHHPEGSVYLANALVPRTGQIVIGAQRRDSSQRELTIEYVAQPANAISTRARVWLLGSIAVVAALSAVLKRVVSNGTSTEPT